MSEQPDEQDIPFEEPQPSDPIQQPGGPQDEPEPEQDETPEPAETPTSESPEEIDAIYTKLERRAQNYAKSVGEIIEGTGVPVELCEMCADCYPGMRWLEPRDENHAAMIAVSGSAQAQSPLTEDPDAILCERCNGFGWTKLPSKVPGNEQRMCRRCGGAGWLDRHPESGAPVQPTYEAPNGETETLPGVPDHDPSVVDLRARGFTVIPPIKIAVPGEQGSANG